MMKAKFEASKADYYGDYDDLMRFISYFYQAVLVKKLKPVKILEVGVGNKTLSNYLKQQGFDITTCDICEDLKPDYVGDIRELPFADGSYDVVLAYEILEHLPWGDVNRALKELHRVTRRYVTLSIPYSALCFEFILRFPLIGTILKRRFLDLFCRFPLFFLGSTCLKEHYWEMGRKGSSFGTVRRLLKSRFSILEEVRPILNLRHYFFVLEKQ